MGGKVVGFLFLILVIVWILFFISFIWKNKDDWSYNIFIFLYSEWVYKIVKNINRIKLKRRGYANDKTSCKEYK